jgi:replicative DNA helicase
VAVNIEKCLISAVIHDGEINDVLDAKITLDFFEDEEHTQVWTWLLKHWTEHSKVPDESTLKRNYPNYKLTATPEPIGYYIGEIQARRKYTIIMEAILAATEQMEDANDVEAALDTISLGVAEAHAQVSSLKNDILTQDTDKWADLYDELAAHPGRLRGLSTGYRAIDRATRGVQPEQYIVIAGPPKSAKSTVLMDIGITMNEEHNARVLLVSFEMSREEQASRHYAMRARVDFNKLMEGRLSKKDMRKLHNALDDVKEFEDFILSTDISAMTTVSGVRSQVEQVKPDILLLDGIYLMQDEHGERPGSPQALTNISRGLKRMAQATKIPLIATTQALESKISKARGMESSSVGYSSAFGQDCDVLLGVERDAIDPALSNLRVLLSRSGPTAKTQLMIDWTTSTITEQEWVDDTEGGDDGKDSDNAPKTY